MSHAVRWRELFVQAEFPLFQVRFHFNPLYNGKRLYTVSSEEISEMLRKFALLRVNIHKASGIANATTSIQIAVDYIRDTEAFTPRCQGESQTDVTRWWRREAQGPETAVLVVGRLF